MWHAVPIENLLFLLRSYTVVFIHEVKEWALGFFERCIGARLQVAQVREYAFLKLLRVLHRSPKGLESE